MPEYEIEDSETGLKLVVVGDGEPTQQDADELIQKEFNDIKTNLFQLPDNKWYLDVGPLQANRVAIDKIGREGVDLRKNIEAYESAKPFADARNPQEQTWGQAYNEQYSRFLKTNSPAIPPSIAESVMKIHPPGTLLIDAHGGRKNKNLSSDWGHEFTMQNLRALIGDDAKGISNIVNTACYGASCGPADYQAAFEGAKRIRHINTNYPNMGSIDKMKKGNLFSGPEITWMLTDGAWLPIETKQKPTPP